MLFSEPKIPPPPISLPQRVVSEFQCSSASRKFLRTARFAADGTCREFQCSSASRKFLRSRRRTSRRRPAVSVLFSEPKIPLFHRCSSRRTRSAVSVLFSEPKIPLWIAHPFWRSRLSGFSALQRAENSSRLRQRSTSAASPRFQCSSASRKFLKTNSGMRSKRAAVSVLFSEPKIPPYQTRRLVDAQRGGFSALQRAENSSASAASLSDAQRPAVSVLFSEPKSPLGAGRTNGLRKRKSGFSALQRAENSSPTLAPASIHIPDCDDHASSFLSLPGASP